MEEKENSARIINVSVGVERDAMLYNRYIVDIRLMLRDYTDRKDVIFQSIDALRALIRKIDEGE
jgi:hypothetical protein